MKLILLTLLLIGCDSIAKPTEHKFQEGSCIVGNASLEELEAWESKPDYEVFKIVKVGKKHYLIKNTVRDQKVGWTMAFSDIDPYYTWASCP